jgi:hypothetical protein
MTLMQRRRALMAQKPYGEQWDYIWNYTDGMPENNGFTKTATGGSYSYLASDGVVLCAIGAFNIQYVFPVQQTINGVVEIVVKFDSTPSDDIVQGFRFCVSNGSDGGQIMCPTKGLCLMTSSNGNYAEKIADVSTGVWYVIRISLKGPVFDVYLNNEKIVADRANLDLFATQTRIMQQAGGQSTLKSIKYKFS